jgi:hypothetical protein
MTRRRSPVAQAALLLLVAVVACATAAPRAAATAPAATGSLWIKDTVHVLDIFLPDANSDYYLGGFGTKNHARTIITGKVPKARYWSFTAYPIPADGAVTHVHDTDVVQSRGRYTVTIAASCSHIKGTCLATSNAEPAGIVVLRLYVPADLNGKGTGGVALPTIAYTNGAGSPLSLVQASGTHTIQNALSAYRNEHGALPTELTRRYPPAPPAPTPVVDPAPRAVISRGVGKFNNPDNVYEHVHYTTTRGDLVVSAKPPTYQSDSFRKLNRLARPAKKAPQVRYWSLCIVLKDLHTGACLRDEQVRLPARSERFTAIVAPTCPVHGYLNCLAAGPEPLQVSLAYRFLLPRTTFARTAFRGPYGLTARYVGRPG